MTLTLTIENETNLPDGGPLSVAIQGKRGIDIGRDSHLDWTLPDPTRFISGKHCEVRYRDGSYWLHDVSTNGTFLYGADHRLQTPHRLRNGDRFTIGTYIIAAAIAGDEGSAEATSQAAGAAAGAVDYQQLWANPEGVAPPINAKQLKPAELRAPPRPDFLDWAVDVPDPFRESAPAAASGADGSAPSRGRAADPKVDPAMDWAAGPSHAPSVPPPPPLVPTPRRPGSGARAENPWDDDGPPAKETPSAFAQARSSAADLPSEHPAFAPAGGEIGSPDAFLRQLARSAGLPEDLFTRADSAALAQQLGAVLRIVTENLMQLLSARAQSKQLARSAAHTMVQAVDNNPLKFAPSAQEALRIMFGPPTQSYLDSQRAIEQSFEDVKRHQIKTYSAMQHALRMLMADLGPQAIEQGTQGDRGLAGLLTSHKAKLWDAYVARWQAKVRQGDGGPIEAFMLYFAEYYDRGGDEPPRSTW